MEPVTIAWLLALLGSNTLSFFLGTFTERARTERKIKKIKEQILTLSNRSANIEDRYKKLLYLCAVYELSLENASKSHNEDVRKLKADFEPISLLLRQAGASFWERFKVKIQIRSAKKEIAASI